jgi:hypothetical protein
MRQTFLKTTTAPCDRVVSPTQVKIIYSFKIHQLKLEDDF